MKHTVQEVKLRNGARGLLIDVPGATVMSFQFHFRAGNRYVKHKDIYETAHLMEHMAFGANSKYVSEHEYEADFTKNGAYHNAYTSEFTMGYVAECADFEWDRVLNLQRLAICEPRYKQESLEAEKGNVRGELTGYLNNHNRVLWPKVQQVLGEDILSYRQRLQTIANVQLKDIKEHHVRTHTAANMRFVIAGKLHGRKSEIIRQLEDWPLPEGERFEVPNDELQAANPVLIRRKEASNLTFGWSLVLPRKLDDDEAMAMSILNHILTGTMHSRIFGAARQKGVTYGMFSDTTAQVHDSSWDFGGEVNHETAEQLIDIMVREMKTVLSGELTDSEVDAAKLYGLGRHQMGAQTVGQISHFYTSHYFNDDEVRDYEKVPQEIEKITRESIIDTACEFFKTGIWVFAGVGGDDKDEIVRLNDKLATLFKND